MMKLNLAASTENEARPVDMYVQSCINKNMKCQAESFRFELNIKSY